MYIAYSALPSIKNKKEEEDPANIEPETLLRYQAYLDTCDKYSSQIAVIQQYLPGWMPKFK